MINKNTKNMNESMFSQIDLIRQDSKDVRDFVKNIFKDREFKKMSNDKDFIKYLKSIYEGTHLDEEHVKFSNRTQNGTITTGSVQTTNETIKEDQDCWDTHKVGNPKTKISSKTGKRVNNCVPKSESVVNEAKVKFKKDDLVYNKRTKTVGIVRDVFKDGGGDLRTDADGVVNIDELEKYNPIKNKHQSNAKVAPSTEKEVSKRGLFNPFKNESVVNEAKEPEVITQLRKIVKDKQNTLVVDTKSKKKVRVDMQSANVMVQVYDALKQQSNKDKFVKSGIVSMGHMAFKLLKKEGVNEGDGLWANIRAKKARGEKPAHKNSKAHKDAVKAGDKINKDEGVNEIAKFAGWVAIDHKGKRLEIKKSEAKDLYNAKLFAIKKLKVPKSKESMLVIKPGYNESVVNEVNNRLNKKVKSELDAYLKGSKINSPEHQHAIMMILKGALTDANFHSEAKQLPKFFPKAKQSKYVGTAMEGVIEDKGAAYSKAAKWDGHDIIDAFSFYTSMTIGGSFGKKLETLKESVVNESVSKEAMGIAGFTGTRGNAVQKFIDDYHLHAKKLYKFVSKGKLSDRMDFVTALAGKPGNKYQGKIVGMFGESIAEDKNQITKVKKQSGKSEVKFYDILSKVEKKLGSKYNTFLDKSLKDFKQNPSKYKTNADKEEKLFQLS